MRPWLKCPSKIFLLLIATTTLVGSSARGDDVEPAAQKVVVVEESLVWRTRVTPRSPGDWAPAGFEFGVGKPGAFRIEAVCGLPFGKASETPSIEEVPRGGWGSRAPIRLDDQPGDPGQRSDAPQFGVSVASDRAGLRLPRPSFFGLSSSSIRGEVGPTPAWMPDALEFRIERGTDDGALFSVLNADPHAIVTLHNLRFSVASREIPLAEPILLDQKVPLAHPFSDRRQAETPPVVRPKAGFATFEKRFAEIPRPLILGSGVASREFVVGELIPERWIYVEGFATRTDADGRPILDERRLPEPPSEFRYGMRLAGRRLPEIDLARFEPWDEPGGPSAPIGGQDSRSGTTPNFSSPSMGRGGSLGGFGAGGGGAGGGSLAGIPLYEGRTPVPTRGTFSENIEAPPSLGVPSPPPGEVVTRSSPEQGVGPATPTGGPSSPPPDVDGPTSPPPTTPAAVVPEPSTLIGALAGGLWLAWRLGRRRS